MDINELIIIVIPFYLIFLTAFYLFYIRRRGSRIVRKRFFHALKEILENDDDFVFQEKQLNLIYKKLSEKFSHLSSDIRSLSDLLEDFIYLFDAQGLKILKDLFNFDADRILRDKAYHLLIHIRSENPFSSLPAKESSLLQTLKQSIESSNVELGLNTIRQLAEEIEVIDSNVKTGER